MKHQVSAMLISSRDLINLSIEARKLYPLNQLWVESTGGAIASVGALAFDEATTSGQTLEN